MAPFEDEALADSLRQALTEQRVLVPGVEVQRVTTIPKTAAGKAPLIKANISHVMPYHRVRPLHINELSKHHDERSEKQQVPVEQPLSSMPDEQVEEVYRPFEGSEAMLQGGSPGSFSTDH